MSAEDPRATIALATALLFVPATRPDRIGKALAAGADLVIADLEDAVAPAARDSARRALLEWLDANPDGRLLVRINGRSTRWYEPDLPACQRPNVLGLLLPKAERAADVRHAHLETGKPVLPLIETAAGIEAANELAATEGASRLVFGKLDLAGDLGLTPDEDDPEELVFLAYRARICLASRAAGLPLPIDSVYSKLGDAAGLARYARRARRHGFGGMLLIHPNQVEPARAAFRPSAEELAWAGAVLDAAGTAGGAVVAVGGQMVDAPVIARARRLLALGSRRPPGAEPSG